MRFVCPAASREGLRACTMFRFLWLLVAALGTPSAFALAVATTTTLTVAPSSSSVPSKSVITLTANVTGANSTSITMGTVSFYDGLNTFFVPLTGTGSPQPHVVGQAQVQSNGTAVFATILPSATHTLFAVYMPTPQGLGSTSGSVTLMVNGGGQEKLTVNASEGGQKGAYTLQISSSTRECPRPRAH